MKKLVIVLLLLPAYARADEAPKSPPPDPNTPITLTLAEFEAIISAERSSCLAAGALKKLQDQLPLRKK